MTNTGHGGSGDNPRRKYILKIEIGGDTWNDCVHDVAEILRELDQRKDGYDSVMGGYSCGHIVTTEINPDMTPEKYQQELEAWMEKRRAIERSGEGS